MPIRPLICNLYILLSFQAVGQAQIPDKSMRVITYNIWNGFDWGKDTSRHGQFIQWVNFQKPDIFALQELCGYTEEKLKKDAKSWGHDYSMILKEDGYPVGITSKWPIELVEKQRDQLWHGMLHVRTAEIDFFVVHLSPADWKFRKREADLIVQKIAAIDQDKYIVLGDFNAHSPMDADLDRNRHSLLARYRTGDANNEKYQNLRNLDFDYTVMSTFLAAGLLDLSMPFLQPEERYSFPAPALVNIWQTESEIKRHHQRIDFILASPTLFNRCVYSRILNGPETAYLSDHYPVIADFVWE